MATNRERVNHDDDQMMVVITGKAQPGDRVNVGIVGWQPGTIVGTAETNNDKPWHTTYRVRLDSGMETTVVAGFCQPLTTIS